MPSDATNPGRRRIELWIQLLKDMQARVIGRFQEQCQEVGICLASQLTGALERLGALKWADENAIHDTGWCPLKRLRYIHIASFCNSSSQMYIPARETGTKIYLTLLVLILPACLQPASRLDWSDLLG